MNAAEAKKAKLAHEADLPERYYRGALAKIRQNVHLGSIRYQCDEINVAGVAERLKLDGYKVSIHYMRGSHNRLLNTLKIEW